MDGVNDRSDYGSSSFDEENKKEEVNSESNEEDDTDVFCFENDHLALKGNRDYHENLKTIVILEAQREYAFTAIQKLITLKREAEEDPMSVVEKLKSGSLGVPGRQTLPEIPKIDWSRYNFSEPPEPCRTQNRIKLGNDSESPGNAIVKMETSWDKQEKRSKLLVRGREFDDSKPETFNQLWTSEEQRRLEELLVEYPPEEVETRRWKKIAQALGNRTPKQVQSRVQKYFIKLHKAGLPIPGRSPRLQNDSQLRKQFHKHQRNNHFLFKPSTFFPSYDVPMSMSDSEDESSLPKHIFTAKEEQPREKEDNQETSDEEETSTFGEDAKNSIEYRKLALLKKIKKEMERTNGVTKFEHVGYQCDFCREEPIKGIRWHCDECMAVGDSVDFCTDCVINMMDEPENPFALVNPKPLYCPTNLHPLQHVLRPIRGRLGKTTTDVWDPDYMPETFYGGYNYLDPNFMPE